MRLVTLAGMISMYCFCHPGYAQDVIEQHTGSKTDPNTIAPAIINLNFCRPAYPRDALLRSEHGVVKLEFTVGVKGKLAGSRIVKSSGYRDLDTAALTALLHCSFRPAYRAGAPVQASFTIDYIW